MFSILKDFIFGLRYPWSRADVNRWLQPLDIRIVGATDVELCLDLHDANIEHGVPANHRDLYAEVLRSEGVLTFIAYLGSRPVGTFGIHKKADDVYWLTYMLVDPSLHCSGIGATMFISAIAVLDEVGIDSVLLFGALPTAVKFYERLACEKGGTFEGETGQTHYLMRLSGVTSALSAGCRRLLTKSGTTLPSAGYVIPESYWPTNLNSVQVAECP